MSISSCKNNSRGLVIPDALNRAGSPSGLGVNPLDAGRGRRFSQAIPTNDVSIAAYTGPHVFQGLIVHLRAQMTDPGFEFRTWNAISRFYNPNGEPLILTAALTVEVDA